MAIIGQPLSIQLLWRLALLSALLFQSTLLFSKVAPGPPAVVHTITDTSDNQAIGNLAWIYEEQAMELSIDDVRLGNFKDATPPDMSENGLFDIKSHNNYWFALELNTNTEAFNGALIFDRLGNCFPYEFTYKSVDAYEILPNGNITKHITGSRRTKTERDYPNKILKSAIHLQIPAQQKRTIWVRLSHADNCQLRIMLSLQTEKTFHSPTKDTLGKVATILSLGWVLCIIFVVLLLSIWLKERLYYWFLAFTISLFLGRFSEVFRDQVFTTFFHDLPSLASLSTTFLDGIRVICLIQFGRIYVGTKKKFKHTDTTLKVSVVILTIVMVMGLLARSFVMPFADQWFQFRRILSLIGFGLPMIALLRLLLSKDKFAKVFSFGIIGTFTLIVLRVIELMLDKNAPPRDVANLIAFITLLALTLILAYRIKMIFEERKIAQEQKLATERENSEQLERITIASNKFVPHTFLNFLGKSSILDASLGDFAERDVTVLFSDIRGYTALSENMSPADTFRFVSSFNRRMGPIIQEHKGFINQYLGDGMMAIFPESADLTLQAAIAMQLSLRAYNEERLANNKQTIQLGIGLHSGSLIMGIIGDEDRLDAATISDTVNVASRVEGLTKHFGGSILISGDCYERLEQKENFNLRFIKRVYVKGKEQPVTIYECLDGLPAAQLSLKLQTESIFSQGVSAYEKKYFSLAKNKFKQIVESNPTDVAATLYLSKATHNEQYGVSDDWDAVERIDNK